MSFIKLLVFPAVLTLSTFACSSGPDERYFPLPNHELEVVRSQSQSFMVDTLFSGLNWPYGMAFLPDNTVLITEREGKLLRVRNGELQTEPVKGVIDAELRDIILHPQYEENSWIYMTYYIEQTEEDGAYTVLARGRLDGDIWVDNEVLFSAGPFSNGAQWYSSRILFDNDGYIYMTIGQRHQWPREGGRAQKYSWGYSQDLSLYQGSTVRLFDDGRIPPDNPFVDSTDALPEIYSYGHRQNQGLVLHPETGEIWATEHGEMGGDELNILRYGGNYGWPIATHSLNYDGTYITRDTLLEGTVPPVHHWTPSIAPSGLEFVYSDKYPGWEDDLLVASMVQGMVNRSVIQNGRVVRDEKLIQGVGRVRTVKLAPDGFLYVLTENTGLLLRLLPA